LLAALMLEPGLAPLVKVLATTGPASEREGALYVAQDQGFFAATASTSVSFRRATGRSAWRRSVPVNPSCIGARSGANLGAIAEGADLVFVDDGIVRKLDRDRF